MEQLPVVVVGAGPIGLAAAAELVERGQDVVVVEQGDQAGSAVAEWRHVRLFSRWSELVSPAARRLLEPTGWHAPDPASVPTGGEWSQLYLLPLAAALGDQVRYGTKVVGVSRRGRDRVVDAGRNTEPLIVHVRTRDRDGRISARAVMDASGTWSTPSPLGGDGLPALGEQAASDRITYRIPDLADDVSVARYAGKHVVVAGSGHSALTALIALAGLAQRDPSTRISWALRRRATEGIETALGGGEADSRPERGALSLRARAAVESGHVQVVAGFRTVEVEQAPDGRLRLIPTTGAPLRDVDQIVALTGFRPDLSWLSEIRLALDSTLQAPMALAPLIDPNLHSCGSVAPHGVGLLRHPEPDVFLAGMKSYGRAPTFLAMTGYEQVRSIAAALAGDTAAAERVEMVLPESGACGGAAELDDCYCGPIGVQDLTLTAPPAGGC